MAISPFQLCLQIQNNLKRKKMEQLTNQIFSVLVQKKPPNFKIKCICKQ